MESRPRGVCVRGTVAARTSQDYNCRAASIQGFRSDHKKFYVDLTDVLWIFSGEEVVVCVEWLCKYCSSSTDTVKL